MSKLFAVIERYHKKLVQLNEFDDDLTHKWITEFSKDNDTRDDELVEKLERGMALIKDEIQCTYANLGVRIYLLSTDGLGELTEVSND